MVLKKLNMNGELIWSKSWFSEEKLLISILFNHEKLFGLGLKIPPTINYNPLLMKFNF
jgi:hypothetical protein